MSGRFLGLVVLAGAFGAGWYVRGLKCRSGR